VLGSYGGGGLSLEEYNKGLFGFSSLVFLLKKIAKDWLGCLPLLRRVSQDTSCVLVHGVSSCDLGCCNKLFMVQVKC
jgi:hypothetical protein